MRGNEGINAFQERVKRIMSLNIENFRGIKRLREPLNTDADIILITGPNGFGKTSLIDALCLLLTGHYYPERNPLVFSGQWAEGKTSLLRAEAIIEDEKQGLNVRELEVSIVEKSTRNNQITHTGCIWPDENAREIMARASFFYQDLLHRFFDEDGEVEMTLRDFLAPEPKQIAETRKAVDSALKELRQREKSLTVPGVSSEEEINNRRREAALFFSQAWSGLFATASEIDVPVPKRSGEWLLRISGNNLRHGWEGELRNLANECLALFSPQKFAPLPEDADPEASLRRLEMVLQDLKSMMASKLHHKLHYRQQMIMLVDSFPEEEVILAPEYMAEVEKEGEDIRKHIENTQKELKELEILSKHFQNPQGPDLVDILAALRQQGERWLHIPTNIASNKYAPPPRVLEWLQKALQGLYLEGKGLDEHLAEWQAQIEKERQRLNALLFEQERRYQAKSATIDASRRLQELARQSEELQGIIDKIIQEDGGKVPKEKLATLLKEGYGPGALTASNPIQIVNGVQSAVARWLEVEQQNKKREEALHKIKSYAEAKKLYADVLKALEVEKPRSSGSVLQKVFTLPEREIEELQKLINQVFDRFRAVKGLYPFILQPNKKGNRSNIWEIWTADKRPLSTLSTGQKAQLALSMLLSLNIALDRLLPHNIVALDDTTTALDMAQLPRQAMLLRQIAYGAGDTASENLFPRRQIFIVSHHEDLTHRLLDFLVPPEGKTMHIFNFIDWDPQQGPKIEQLKVEPARSVTEKTREAFSRLLHSVLEIE
ncbi:AAA family ATPase [Moorellaceae bacterium AZ2]